MKGLGMRLTAAAVALLVGAIAAQEVRGQAPSQASQPVQPQQPGTGRVRHGYGQWYLLYLRIRTKHQSRQQHCKSEWIALKHSQSNGHHPD